ncbi:MAG: hypothetical protein QXI48_07525 [Candidatus Bathyarchaeia archaeon]
MLSMAHITLLGIGLSVGALKAYGLIFFKVSIDEGYPIGKLSLDRVAIDNTTIRLGKGDMVSYDGI